MFSFSSFGVPVVFAGVLFLSMVVGVTCIWDMWHGRARPNRLNTELERPRFWDLCTEEPVGVKYKDAMWGNIMPFSVAAERPLKDGATTIQIAVAIAMPSAQRATQYSYATNEEEPVVYCIGLHLMEMPDLDLAPYGVFRSRSEAGR